MKFHRSILAVTAVAALSVAGLAGQPAYAQDAASFYKGKTITFITPGSPGGGYDTYMREMIPLLEQKTGATVVPVNEPGGGHLLAVNKTYTADPDGLTILLNDGEASLVGQLLGLPAARYDLLKMNWIGRVNGEIRMLMFTKSSPYKSLKETMAGDTPLKIGITGKADAVGLGTVMMAEALGLKVNIVTGYKGSREFVRAAIQGEVNAIVLSESSSKRFSKGGRLIPITALARDRSALFPDTPTVHEQTDLTDAQAWYLDYHEAFAEVGRSLITGPGVPQERVDFLQKVFGEILNNKDFVADMTKKNRPISYASGDDLKKATDTVLNSLSPEKEKEVKHIILDKYYN